MDLQELFEQMVERCAYRMEIGDYMGEDGLMACGKCHSHKECKVISPNDKSIRIVGCICKCQAAAMRKEGTIK